MPEERAEIVDGNRCSICRYEIKIVDGRLPVHCLGCGRRITYHYIEPTDVGPTHNDVTSASMRLTDDGRAAIDMQVMQSFEGRYGSNGGKGCDVAEGPCSCGAWHDVSENKQLNPEWVRRHAGQQ